jgi:hypothetical protein
MGSSRIAMKNIALNRTSAPALAGVAPRRSRIACTSSAAEKAPTLRKKTMRAAFDVVERDGHAMSVTTVRPDVTATHPGWPCGSGQGIAGQVGEVNLPAVRPCDN